MWYRTVLILPTFVYFLFRRYVFQTFFFIFRSIRPWLGSMHSLLSLLNHWFCCKFTFLVFVIFTKNEFECAVQKRKIFIKSCPICRPLVLFVQSWQIIFGSPFKNCVFVVLCVNFVTLSILLSSIVLYLSKNIVPFICEVRFRLSRLDFFGIFFAKAKSGDYFFF